LAFSFILAFTYESFLSFKVMYKTANLFFAA